MSHAHVCDECKTVAPLETALGWWTLRAIDNGPGVVLSMAQKAEYDFCSWTCASAFLARMAPLLEGVVA